VSLIEEPPALDRLIEDVMGSSHQAFGVIGRFGFFVASVAASRRGDRWARNSASQT